MQVVHSSPAQLFHPDAVVFQQRSSGIAGLGTLATASLPPVSLGTDMPTNLTYQQDETRVVTAGFHQKTPSVNAGRCTTRTVQTAAVWTAQRR